MARWVRVMAKSIPRGADRWLLRVAALAVMLVALWLVVSTAVDWALWRRDVTRAVLQLQQAPAPRPAP